MPKATSPTDKALNLLSQCLRDLYGIDDGGAYEELDLTRAVTRLRKIVETLVPPARQNSYLNAIDAGLVITADERQSEVVFARILPGPFLSNRAKRVAHVAEELRDDVNLGRLPIAVETVRRSDSILEPAVDSSMRASAQSAAGDAQRSQLESVGEPPPPVKWLIWIWTNTRKHPLWALLAVAVIGVAAIPVAMDWVRALNSRAKTAALLPNDSPEVNLPKATAQPTQLPLMTTTVPKSSHEMPSGACDGYSGWYELCSDGQPPGWQIVADSFQLSGNRSCTTGFAECKRTIGSSTRVCYEFRLQGHKEECNHPGNTGIQNSIGNLTVTWQHH